MVYRGLTMSNDRLKDNKIYSTSDLFLAATLTLWFPVESLDKTDPQKVIFNFTEEENLKTTVDAYWSNALQVEPKALLNNLKTLKSRLYQE